MTAYTRSELAARVLRYEGLLAPDESARPEDLADTEEIIESEMASMASRQIMFWNTTDDSIETEYLMPLVKRLGPIVGAGFGKYSSIDATVAANRIESLELRQLSAVRPTGAVVGSEYY
jgi:hypothetical protein